MIDVLFVDPVAATPYTVESLEGGPLGGTEASVLRIAQGLRQQGLSVALAQSARRQPRTDSSGLRYLPYDHREPLERARNVVLLRACKLMKSIRDRAPEARRYLWLHCFPGARRRHLLSDAHAYGFTVLTVSQAHRDALLRRCSPNPRPVDIRVAYNPVVVPSFTDPKPRCREKLVYFSSPHKGLEQVLTMFAYVRREMPEMRLYLANPGYLADADILADGVIPLGSLSHREVLDHVREALCVFYPQTVFAETFGLVFAEANALGTPVLAHDLGAASEVLGSEQLVDCANPNAVLAKLRDWRQQATFELSLKPEFRRERVLRDWLDLLEDPASHYRFDKAS